jgi:hypothetical protein
VPSEKNLFKFKAAVGIKHGCQAITGFALPDAR